MLKWTVSTQKLTADTTAILQQTPTNSTMLTTTTQTPRFSATKRRKRRATIANKENIPVFTSTPMTSRTRNSPLVLAPLVDILNVTPETVDNRTLEERRRWSSSVFANPNVSSHRRHSTTVGLTPARIPQYAATLPKYEEEYSPSTILPTGQQLALRGLLPDPFMDNPRYFTTPQVTSDKEHNVKGIKSITKKRKLEQEFVAIAKEQDGEEEGALGGCKQQTTSNRQDLNNTGLVSNKMGDQTLDHLIDAILHSARKEEKKRKPRKSFNLRRRTLLKNQVEQQQDIILSPSYAAGDDPCSDLSFLDCEGITGSCIKRSEVITPIPPASSIPSTPLTINPQPHTPATRRLLLQMPTPPRRRDSFSLDTPVRPKLKRRSESSARTDTSAKKYKVDSRNYFEVGVALPSIYV